MRRPVIGVMGPSEADAQLAAAAYELGALIAHEGWIVLTGGRPLGVMEAASRGAKTVSGSITVGILPTDYQRPAVSDSVDIAIFTNMGDARNAINVQSSDVVIACGARSAGTVSEIALALKAGKPVILLGASEVAQQFFTTCGGDNIWIADTPSAVIDAIRQLGVRRDNRS